MERQQVENAIAGVSVQLVRLIEGRRIRPVSIERVRGMVVAAQAGPVMEFVTNAGRHRNDIAAMTDIFEELHAVLDAVANGDQQAALRAWEASKIAAAHLYDDVNREGDAA